MLAVDVAICQCLHSMFTPVVQSEQVHFWKPSKTPVVLPSAATAYSVHAAVTMAATKSVSVPSVAAKPASLMVAVRKAVH